MSDRDKLIIVVVLLLAIGFCPYFFYIKDTKVTTEALLAQNVELQARLDYLNSLEANRGDYISETERLNEERDAIIASFPGGILQENYTMFLLNTEYSTLTMDAATGELIWEHPIRFSAVSYADNIEMPISGENAETVYTAVTNLSTIEYRCYYGGMKYLLEYFMEYEDPMIYSGITMEYDDEFGVISGEILLAQYAISGPDREVAPVEIWPDLDMYDLRGNEEVGIFGPITHIEEEEVTEGEEGTDGEVTIEEE